MAKDRRNKDQKRKAKLAARTQRVQRHDYLTPYEGRKYQAVAWVPVMLETELGIFEGIVASQRQLTNDQVHEAIVRLLEHLHAKHPPELPPDTPTVAFAPGNEVAFLCWSVRRHWGDYFAKSGPVASADLIGILRTILRSMETHQWKSGAARGYVEFLYEFILQGPVKSGSVVRTRAELEAEAEAEAEQEA